MHINNYIYLSNKRSSLCDSFVCYLSYFDSFMYSQNRFGTQTLHKSNALFVPYAPNPPGWSPGVRTVTCCLLLNLFKKLLIALQHSLSKPLAKYLCCATRDLVYWGSVRSPLSLKTKTPKPYAGRVLAWRNLDKFHPALISFFSPFKRYLPSSHTDVSVLKTQPSKERINK